MLTIEMLSLGMAEKGEDGEKNGAKNEELRHEIKQVLRGKRKDEQRRSAS